MELLAAVETLAGWELLACHGAPANLIEAALQGPRDMEGARQPERAEQERDEHGQGDEPPAAWSPLRRRRRTSSRPSVVIASPPPPSPLPRLSTGAAARPIVGRRRPEPDK